MLCESWPWWRTWPIYNIRRCKPPPDPHEIGAALLRLFLNLMTGGLISWFIARRTAPCDHCYLSFPPLNNSLFSPSSDSGESFTALTTMDNEVSSINTRVPFLGFMFGSMLSQTVLLNDWRLWDHRQIVWCNNPSGIPILLELRSWSQVTKSHRKTLVDLHMIHCSQVEFHGLVLTRFKVLIVWYVHTWPVLLSISCHSNQRILSLAFLTACISRFPRLWCVWHTQATRDLPIPMLSGSLLCSCTLHGQLNDTLSFRSMKVSGLSLAESARLTPCPLTIGAVHNRRKNPVRPEGPWEFRLTDPTWMWAILGVVIGFRARLLSPSNMDPWVIFSVPPCWVRTNCEPTVAENMSIPVRLTRAIKVRRLGIGALKMGLIGPKNIGVFSHHICICFRLVPDLSDSPFIWTYVKSSLL